MLKLSSDVSDVFPTVLKLSSEVSECKPLPARRSTTMGIPAMGQFSQRLAAGAQVEIESKTWKHCIMLKVQVLSSIHSTVPGAFNVGLIGATCTALPRATQPPPRPPRPRHRRRRIFQRR